MPILTARAKNKYKQVFRECVHNGECTVRLAVETDLSIPGYTGQKQVSFYEFTGFRCSAYKILSGKLTRIFGSKSDIISLPIGVLDSTTHLVEYVPGYYDLLVATYNAASDEVNGLSGTGFLSLNIMPDAVLVNETKGMTGTISEVTNTHISCAAFVISAGDVVKVYNSSRLVNGDRVFLEGSWRTVLSVINDSEGVQVSTLLGA